MNTDHLKDFILSQFDIPKDSYSLVANKTGLINKSFSVIDSAGQPVYFLQEIDKKVFKDIEGLMSNIRLITTHFRKLEHPPAHLEFINTTSNQSYLKTNKGSYWRLYTYCPGKSYDIAENKEMAAVAGTAFGEFLRAIETIDVKKLAVTIPNFHNINFRYAQFIDSTKNADQSRLVKSEELIELVDMDIKLWIDFYNELGDRCTLQPTHNDTKLNNLIISDTEPAVVVDYDTIMPGYIALDYGDAVRTICSTTAEDSIDLDEIGYDLSMIRSFSLSFIKALNLNNKSQDLDFLARAICFMPFLMGLRMLTDYLNNDIYYSTNYANHNLDRAKNQITLYRKGMTLLPQINSLISIKNQQEIL
jgi:hypothetical protein